MSSVRDKISDKLTKGQKLFAWLIDPDKESTREFEKRIRGLDVSGIDLIFLGGSLLLNDRLTEYIHTIRKYFDLPVILFPGSTNQVNNNADGILLLSLISGRNPDFLIGRHVEVASILRQSKLEVFPTAYLLVDSGVQTTASYISNTMPIPNHKVDIAVNTAIAGELLGLQYIFLDAGSGAVIPVSKEMIAEVKANTNSPLIVGGGIKNAGQMEEVYQAGADIIVVGNVIEQDIHKLKEFTETKKAFQEIN